MRSHARIRRRKFPALSLMRPTKRDTIPRPFAHLLRDCFRALPWSPTAGWPGQVCDRLGSRAASNADAGHRRLARHLGHGCVSRRRETSLPLLLSRGGAGRRTHRAAAVGMVRTPHRR